MSKKTYSKIRTKNPKGGSLFESVSMGDESLKIYLGGRDSKILILDKRKNSLKWYNEFAKSGDWRQFPKIFGRNAIVDIKEDSDQIHIYLRDVTVWKNLFVKPKNSLWLVASSPKKYEGYVDSWVRSARCANGLEVVAALF